MENCIDTDYLQPKDKTAEASTNATCCNDFYLSNDAEEKNECKNCCKVSRVDQEITSQEWTSGSPIILHNSKRDRTGRPQNRTKVNVLKKDQTETVTLSVQKKTKTNKSIVPDRLGTYVKSSVRCETKLSLSDGDKSEKSTPLSLSAPSLKKISAAGDAVGGKDREGEYKKTKIALLRNECLSNKEADRLRNSFESDLETKNIFENFFDDCLDSTSKGKGESSQDLHGERRRAEERTPEKKSRETSLLGAPVKVRDHNSYYSSPKNIRHVCEYCHKIFKSNGKLNSHVYSHTGERPFVCSHCGKAFSSKFKLVRHLLIHSEIRKFVCQICDRTFLRNDHLKNHYKVHDPQKKMYKCPKENCDKEYSSVMSHKKHMAYHNVEDGDLKCLICNVKYETKEEILFHLKSHSGSRLFKTQSDKKFKCEFCDRLFLTRKDVTRHLVVHTGERDFLCQFCPQRFGRKDHLVRHIKKSHGNEGLVRDEDVRTNKGMRKSRGKPSRRAVVHNNFESLTTTKETKKTSDTNIINDTSDTINTNKTSSLAKDDKTHILITVQGKAFQNQKKKQKLPKRPFQKNEMLVPKKKQVPLSKNSTKHPTTQILLQNIPNILIIPNNSIILLRNQAAAKKNPADLTSPSPPPSAPPAPRPDAPAPASAPPDTCATNDFINFNYDPNTFPSPSDLLAELPEPDTFCNFHPDLAPFPAPFDEPDFVIPTHGDLLPDGAPFPDASRPPPHPPPPPKNKAFFDSGDALLLDEAALDADPGFKDAAPAAAAPPPDDSAANEGVLGNLFNQGNDNCGFELLRHLLTTENPVLSPLPGFSQIFHNSNAHPN